MSTLYTSTSDTANRTLRRVLVKVLEHATPSLRELARQAGISYRAIRAYRSGQRTPPPQVLRKITAALRRHSARLQRMASELETAGQGLRPRKRKEGTP